MVVSLWRVEVRGMQLGDRTVRYWVCTLGPMPGAVPCAPGTVAVGGSERRT